jgi:ArsR family transcriptional regulator, arsenate/arsenite/antimonite-responsive transcriptional repressor
MGASKTENFSKKQNLIALQLKALGHPARVAIIEYLMSVDTCICGDIVDVLPLSQPTVSQHLRELKNAGLIKGSVDGTSICYCVDEKAITKIRSYFDGIADSINAKKNCC